MKTILLYLIFGISILNAQVLVKGKVLDAKGMGIEGANVYLEGTYDGGNTLADGTFLFTTLSTGEQTLVISFLSFQTRRIVIPVNRMQGLEVVLWEDLNSLDAVVLNAGSFEAGAASRASVLKPLDIVTTAGSAGNIIAALQTLPGTQQVGEDGRLFVRGGDSYETQTFIDGLRVSQPYSAGVPNIPVRGRFSPFLFKGMSFSTGGYSAEYGNALSSVLVMNTEDEAPEAITEISLMSVGVGLGNTQKWEKNSLSLNAAYTNLEPYQKLIPQNIIFPKAFEILSGEAIYRNSLPRGTFKAYAAYDFSSFGIEREEPGAAIRQSVDLTNNNFHFNTSYSGWTGDNWNIFSGLSLGTGKNHIKVNRGSHENKEDAVHLKTKIGKKISNRIRFNSGAEYFYTNFWEKQENITGSVTKYGYSSNLTAIFTETDIFFSRNFALKAGLRYSYYAPLQKHLVSPRIAVAYKISKSSQFSMSYGDFYQNARQEVLQYGANPNLEEAKHYIINYQYSKSGRTFRLESYFKDYSNLVTYNTLSPGPASVFTNEGNGYARGIDFFWRDNYSINKMDYWISWSFIDTKRKYLHYPDKVTPGFVANHNLSLVTKYWVESLRSQAGFTYNFSSGRAYNDPNSLSFMGEKTKNFHNLSFNWAYLLSDQKILYFSVSNIPGTKNSFGYEYATSPNEVGIYESREIVPVADRFFFIGFFWTISKDKTKNQLENL